MAEIHCLAPEIGADQAHNLVRSLTDRIARGVDPGPRDGQIRSLGRVLERSARALRADLAQLGLPEAAIQPYLDRLERTAQLACGYDPHGRQPAA